MKETEKSYTITDIVIHLIFIIKRYWLLILVFFILGLIAGLFLVDKPVKYYKNVSIFSTVSDIPYNLIKEISEPVLNHHKYSGGRKLEQLINIRNDAVSSIMSFSLDSIAKSTNVFFKFGTTLKDSSYSDEIIKGYLSFISNSDGVKDIFERVLEKNKKLLEIVTKQTEMHDHSLKISGLSNDSFKSYLELVELKEKLMQETNLSGPINLVNSRNYCIVETPSRKLNIIKYVLLSLISVSFLIWIIELAKRVRNRKVN